MLKCTYFSQEYSVYMILKLFKVHVNILDVLYKDIKNKGTDRNREPEQAIYAFKIIAPRS